MTQSQPNSPAEAPTQSGLNPKTNFWKQFLKAALWIGGFFAVILIIGFLNEDPYPSSRDEMAQFLTNKYWKYEEVEITYLEYDGKVISKPTSDIRSSVRKLATGSNDEEYWQMAEYIMDKTITDNSAFIFFRQLPNGEFTYYTQITDLDLQMLTYQFGNIDIQQFDDKYQFDLKNISQSFTFEDEPVDNPDFTETHQAKIVGLSNEMLSVEETFRSRSKIDGTSFSLTTTTKYKVVSESILDTKNVKRIIENSGL